MSPKRRLPPGLAPRAAPGDLRLVQDFVNTLDDGAGHDDLGSPRELATWLSQRGLASLDERLTKKQWRHALAIRDGLRALIRAHNRGQRLDMKAVTDLNQAAAEAETPHRFHVGADGKTGMKSLYTCSFPGKTGVKPYCTCSFPGKTAYESRGGYR